MKIFWSINFAKGLVVIVPCVVVGREIRSEGRNEEKEKMGDTYLPDGASQASLEKEQSALTDGVLPPQNGLISRLCIILFSLKHQGLVQYNAHSTIRYYLCSS